MKNTVLISAIIILSISGLSRPGNTQGIIPVLPTEVANTRQRRVMSAAEAAHHLRFKDQQMEAAIASSQTDYPQDSLLKAISAAAAQWLTNLQQRPIKGIQLDPSGRVSVAAHSESVAKAQIAERLATPNLSAYDKAFTYMTAVQAFSNWHYPERLPVAEGYVKQLAAMGDSAAFWEYYARESLVFTYYLLGSTPDIVRHGERALALVGIMPFHNRITMFIYGGSLYSKVIEATTGVPNGHARIDAMNAKLEAATKPSSRLIALDSIYTSMGQDYVSGFRILRQNAALLGTQGKPLVANYWVSRGPTRDSAEIRLDDGKIRVVTMSGYGCPACMQSLHGLQRLKARFPAIETMYMTFTVGSWGNRLVEPQEEAEHLADHFLNVMKLSIPIGIWKSTKVINEDGGLAPEDYGPNQSNYPPVAKPMIYVFDGKGTVRSIIVGFDRDIEKRIARTVQFLEREATAAQESRS